MKSEPTKLLPVFLKSFGIALLFFLGLNLLTFLYELSKQGWNESSQLSFKYGSFYLNEVSNGPIWGSSTATFLLFATFCICFFLMIEKERKAN